ncbi:hypothetical protein Droror1_Dr00014940 [Drosera rotundifolia]
MKFLLECVTCCRTTTTDTPPDHHHPLSPSSPSSPSLSSPKSEETRSLVRRTRRTAGGGEWRPSLLAISEEGTTESVERKRIVDDRKRVVVERKRCGFEAGAGRHRSHHGGHERFRNETIPMVVPAFASTPFMF